MSTESHDLLEVAKDCSVSSFNYGRNRWNKNYCICNCNKKEIWKLLGKGWEANKGIDR